MGSGEQCRTVGQPRARPALNFPVFYVFIAVYKLTTSAANIPYFASVHAFPLARRNIARVARVSSQQQSLGWNRNNTQLRQSALSRSSERRRMTSTDLFAALHHVAIGTPFCSTPFYTPNGAVCEQYKCSNNSAEPLVLLDCITTPAQSAISIKMQIAVVLYQDRRASTPLTARLSQNGGHHHARPQRRVPTSRGCS